VICNREARAFVQKSSQCMNWVITFFFLNRIQIARGSSSSSKLLWLQNKVGLLLLLKHSWGAKADLTEVNWESFSLILTDSSNKSLLLCDKIPLCYQQSTLKHYKFIFIFNRISKFKEVICGFKKSKMKVEHLKYFRITLLSHLSFNIQN
jgi:hypothetical protein